MEKWIQEYTDFIFLQQEPEPADIIFLPGCREGALARAAAELWEKGYAPYILVSGKYGKQTGHCSIPGYATECDYFCEILLKEGIPENALLKEREATYTYENAIFSRQLTERKGISVKTAILCTQAYHARRCSLYYSILFPESRLLVCPVITKGISRENWYRSQQGIDLVLGEVERCGSQFHQIFTEYFIDR